MAAKRGKSGPAAIGWSGGPLTSPTLIVDPKNENNVYKPTSPWIMSEDGGKASAESERPHGDFHDVWVNPDNTDQVIAGDDGGVWYPTMAAIPGEGPTTSRSRSSIT